MGFGICTYANCCTTQQQPPPPSCVTAFKQSVRGYSYLNAPIYFTEDTYRFTRYFFDWAHAYSYLFPPDGQDDTRSYPEYFTYDRTRNYSGYLWTRPSPPATATCHRYDFQGNICSYALQIPRSPLSDSGYDVYPAEEGSDWLLTGGSYPGRVLEASLCSDNVYPTNQLAPSNLDPPYGPPCYGLVSCNQSNQCVWLPGKSWTRQWSRLGWAWDQEQIPGGPHVSMLDYYRWCLQRQISRAFLVVRPPALDVFAGFSGIKVNSGDHFLWSTVWPRVPIDAHFTYQLRLSRRPRDVDLARLALAADANVPIGFDDMLLWSFQHDITQPVPTIFDEFGGGPATTVAWSGPTLRIDITEFLRQTDPQISVLGIYFCSFVTSSPGASISHSTGDWKYTVEYSSILDTGQGPIRIHTGFGTKHAAYMTGELEFE